MFIYLLVKIHIFTYTPNYFSAKMTAKAFFFFFFRSVFTVLSLRYLAAALRYCHGATWALTSEKIKVDAVQHFISGHGFVLCSCDF